MKIDLCKIFGVEEGEEFRIKGICVDEKSVYLIRNNMLHYRDKEPLSCLYVNDLNNITKVIKLPKRKEFTDDELAIMRSLPKEYKWMARDTGIGNVSAFKEKPTKNEYGYWVSEGKYCILIIFNHLFKSITSKDEEPVFIDDYVER